MKLNNIAAINVVLNVIRKHVDSKASVSRKTGKPVIHYAVPNGGVHAVVKGKEVPTVLFRKIDESEARRICQDMGWTHNNREK